MKILIPALHYYPVIGGIETWTQNIAERLSQKVEVFVVTGKVRGLPNKEIFNGVKIWRTSLFSLTNLSKSPLVYSLHLLPFIFFKSLNIIRKEKINILHCQGFLSGFLGFLLSKLTKIPYIITVQRIEEKNNFIKRIVYKNANCCIGASLAIKKYFEEMGCKNIEVIPNGVDVNRFRIFDSNPEIREKLGIGNEFLIITVARLEKVKGIEYLIKAMKELKIKDSKLLIIGEGSERKNLENLVRERGLENKVKFLGQIENEKVPQYLAIGDCFVLPSLKEGFGIAILEAQAVGLPVIATNVGGIPDIIKDGKTGILVPARNPEAIAKAIFKIYSQLSFAQKLVQNAKANLENYNWDKIAQKVYLIYQKLSK